ncbi:MAG TPA: CAP domain-containing protein [Candidatus Tectomicrobia bacterium]|jgi:uncharacterized protein YkwD
MRPELMPAIVLRLAALAVMGVICAGCQDISKAQTSQATNVPEVEPMLATLVTLHNQERSRAGLPTLTMDTRLMRAAQLQAQYMARSKKSTHQGQGGTTPGQRLQQQGYHAIQVAENIAHGQATAAAVLQAWMHSRPHRQNILGAFSNIGAARALSADGVPYWCVVFGLPLPTLDPTLATAEVVTLLNQQRTAAGLSPLEAHPRLAEVAQAQARTMAAGTTPYGQTSAAGAVLEQLQRAGYRYRKISQGAVSGAPTPLDMVQELMHTPASKERVLGDFTQVGVGYATAQDGTSHWHILFGLPQH